MLQGKTALITGAATGIGRATALDMARNGANIALNHYGTPEEAAEACQLILAEGVRCEIYDCNVGNYEMAKQLVADVISDFDRVDILVNNAGIVRDGIIMRISDEDWDEVLDVNLKSAFVLTKYLFSHFAKNRSGSIINIASVCGLNGWERQANYAASKGGLISLTKTVAKEIASRGVSCNAICPGFVATNMTSRLKGEARNEFEAGIPMGRLGNPEDISGIAVFLASDAARYITGETIRVDGGLCI